MFAGRSMLDAAVPEAAVGRLPIRVDKRWRIGKRIFITFRYRCAVRAEAVVDLQNLSPNMIWQRLAPRMPCRNSSGLEVIWGVRSQQGADTCKGGLRAAIATTEWI